MKKYHTVSAIALLNVAQRRGDVNHFPVIRGAGPARLAGINVDLANRIAQRLRVA